jgi:hypothetical protein
MNRSPSEGMMLVRAELRGRLDALEKALAARGSLGVGAHADAIAALAGDYGLQSVQRLAEGLSVALGAGGRGAAVGPWIERLRDSIGCESVDEQAGTSWLASVMIRLAG